MFWAKISLFPNTLNCEVLSSAQPDPTLTLIKMSFGFREGNQLYTVHIWLLTDVSRVAFTIAITAMFYRHCLLSKNVWKQWNLSSLFVRWWIYFRLIAYALEKNAPYALSNMQLSYWFWFLFVCVTSVDFSHFDKNCQSFNIFYMSSVHVIFITKHWWGWCSLPVIPK